MFDPVSGAQVRTFFNAGGAEITGLEAEITALLGENFTFLLNIGLLDTQYKEDVIDEVRDDILLVAGDPLPFSPESSYSVSAIYALPFASGRELRLRADYSWRDDLLWDATGEREDRDGQEAYGVLNLNATYEFEGWALSVFGRNVTDEGLRHEWIRK